MMFEFLPPPPPRPAEEDPIHDVLTRVRSRERLVLVVDDEPLVLRSVARAARRLSYAVEAVDAPDRAVAMLEQGLRPDVIISDQRMPGLLGTELLSQVRDRWPNVIRVCMSGHADRDEIVSAINGGEVFRFLLKPWSLEAFDSTLRDAVREADVLAEHVAMQRMLHQQNERLRTLQGDMDRAVEERARELHLRQACTEEALLQALSALRRGDGEMVSTFAVAIGERLGISPNDMGTLRLGVALRDVMGRLGKPIDAGRGAPSPAALARVVEACQARADLAALVRGMDARWDGSGEGSGPRGATIPLPARIARIAETAVGRLMAGDSPSNAQIAAALRAESGTSLDPDLVGPAATLVELGALRRIVDEGTREPSPAAPVYVAGPFSGAAG